MGLETKRDCFKPLAEGRVYFKALAMRNYACVNV